MSVGTPVVQSHTHTQSRDASRHSRETAPAHPYLPAPILTGKCPYLKLGLQYGNAVHAVRTQCEVLDIGKYLDPTFGPF